MIFTDRERMERDRMAGTFDHFIRIAFYIIPEEFLPHQIVFLYDDPGVQRCIIPGNRQLAVILYHIGTDRNTVELNIQQIDGRIRFLRKRHIITYIDQTVHTSHIHIARLCQQRRLKQIFIGINAIRLTENNRFPLSGNIGIQSVMGSDPKPSLPVKA